MADIFIFTSVRTELMIPKWIVWIGMKCIKLSQEYLVLFVLVWGSGQWDFIMTKFKFKSSYSAIPLIQIFWKEQFMNLMKPQATNTVVLKKNRSLIIIEPLDRPQYKRMLHPLMKISESSLTGITLVWVPLLIIGKLLYVQVSGIICPMIWGPATRMFLCM